MKGFCAGVHRLDQILEPIHDRSQGRSDILENGPDRGQGIPERLKGFDNRPNSGFDPLPETAEKRFDGFPIFDDHEGCGCYSGNDQADRRGNKSQANRLDPLDDHAEGFSGLPHEVQRAHNLKQS